MGKRLKKLDEDIRHMTRSMDEDRSSKQFGDNWPFLPDVYRSLFAVPEVVHDKDGAKLYRVEIPIGKQFVADNVKIVLKNYHLTVDAVLEDKSPDGKQHFFTEIKRQITLPEYVDLEKVKSVMGDDGVLRVQAPVKAGMEPPSATKEIPIKHVK